MCWVAFLQVGVRESSWLAQDELNNWSYMRILFITCGPLGLHLNSFLVLSIPSPERLHFIQSKSLSSCVLCQPSMRSHCSASLTSAPIAHPFARSIPFTLASSLYSEWALLFSSREAWPQITAWFLPSLPSGLCSNITFPEAPWNIDHTCHSMLLSPLQVFLETYLFYHSLNYYINIVYCLYT